MSEIISKRAVDIAREELLGTSFEDANISADTLPIKTVGVQGDDRSYGRPLVLQFNEKIPFKVLAKISGRITNEVGEINKVTLDITHLTVEQIS